MKLTLVRHTSVDVLKGVCYGQSDVPLKTTFEQEAAVTAEKLNGLYFDSVFVSPLSRCVRLADYCGYPEAIRDARIKELDFGEWEMQRFDRIQDPRLEEWYQDYINVAATGGESFRMQLRRVSAFLDELREREDECVAAFTHGGVILCAQVYAGLITAEEAFDALTPYGGILQIDLEK